MCAITVRMEEIMQLVLSQSSRLESIWQLFSVTIIFLIVLGLAYLSSIWISKIQKNQTSNKNIEVIETVKINTNKYIQIVRIGEKYLVIAVAKDTISMLTQIEKEQLNLLDEETIPKESFSDIFNKLKELKHKK